MGGTAMRNSERGKGKGEGRRDEGTEARGEGNDCGPKGSNEGTGRLRVKPKAQEKNSPSIWGIRGYNTTLRRVRLVQNFLLDFLLDFKISNSNRASPPGVPSPDGRQSGSAGSPISPSNGAPPSAPSTASARIRTS